MSIEANISLTIPELDARVNCFSRVGLPQLGYSIMGAYTTNMMTNKTLVDTTNNIAANKLRVGDLMMDIATTLPINGQVLTAQNGKLVFMTTGPVMSAMNEELIADELPTNESVFIYPGQSIQTMMDKIGKGIYYLMPGKYYENVSIYPGSEIYGYGKNTQIVGTLSVNDTTSVDNVIISSLSVDIINIDHMVGNLYIDNVHTSGVSINNQTNVYFDNMFIKNMCAISNVTNLEIDRCIMGSMSYDGSKESKILDINMSNIKDTINIYAATIETVVNITMTRLGTLNILDPVHLNRDVMTSSRGIGTIDPNTI